MSDDTGSHALESMLSLEDIVRRLTALETRVSQLEFRLLGASLIGGAIGQAAIYVITHLGGGAGP